MIINANVGDWIAEKCSTAGTGDLVLTGPIDQTRIKFIDVLPAGGVVWYSINDGLNRESGYGTFVPPNIIQRTNVQTRKIGTLFESPPPSPLVLSGNAIVSSTFTAAAFTNIITSIPPLDDALTTTDNVWSASKIAAEIEAKYPFLKIYMTGMVIMNNAFSEASIHDMQTLVPLSFGIMMLVLLLMIRGFAGTVMTMVVIVMSIVSAMGAGGYLGYPITPPSASAPTIILTVAIANSVHVLVTFYHHMREGMEKKHALTESLRINLQPVFLTSITTAIRSEEHTSELQSH